MYIYKDFLILIIGFFVIIKGADILTCGAEGIARAFKIPRVIIGLTIVSLATAAPEFTVSVISSYRGYGAMAVGNALGSCIVNIGLVLAIAAIIRVIHFNHRVIKQELLFLIAAVVILYLLMLDGSLSPGDGLFLCFLMIAFLTYIILREFKARGLNEQGTGEEYNLKNDAIKFLAGAAAVILSARYAIIPSAINIAHFFKLPEIVIGLTLVALGTSLPELVTAVVASVKKMGDMAAGNVIGANILNLFWVLGVSSLVNPLNIDIQTKRLTMPVVLLVTACMFIFSRTRFQLTRKEGLALLAIYAGYIFYIFKFAYIQTG